MSLKLGKRYACATCATTVLVTKPSAGTLSCCSAEMEQLKPKKTASSD